MTLLQKAGSVYTSKDWGEVQGHGCAWVAACCRWHAEPMHPQHVNLLLLGAYWPTQKCTHGMNEGCVHALRLPLGHLHVTSACARLPAIVGGSISESKSA
jgi:hypothetical protein